MLLGEAWYDPVSNQTSEIDELANYAIKRLEGVRELISFPTLAKQLNLLAASVRRHLGKARGESSSILLAVLFALFQPIRPTHAVALVPDQWAALRLSHTASNHNRTLRNRQFFFLFPIFRLLNNLQRLCTMPSHCRST